MLCHLPEKTFTLIHYFIDKKNSIDQYTALLVQTLKDHNRREMIEHAITFYNQELAKAAMKHHKVIFYHSNAYQDDN